MIQKAKAFSSVDLASIILHYYDNEKSDNCRGMCGFLANAYLDLPEKPPVHKALEHVNAITARNIKALDIQQQEIISSLSKVGWIFFRAVVLQSKSQLRFKHKDNGIVTIDIDKYSEGQKEINNAQHLAYRLKMFDKRNLIDLMLEHDYYRPRFDMDLLVYVKYKFEEIIHIRRPKF